MPFFKPKYQLPIIATDPADPVSACSVCFSRDWLSTIIGQLEYLTFPSVWQGTPEQQATMSQNAMTLISRFQEVYKGCSSVIITGGNTDLIVFAPMVVEAPGTPPFQTESDSSSGGVTTHTITFHFPAPWPAGFTALPRVLNTTSALVDVPQLIPDDTHGVYDFTRPPAPIPGVASAVNALDSAISNDTIELDPTSRILTLTRQAAGHKVAAVINQFDPAASGISLEQSGTSLTLRQPQLVPVILPPPPGIVGATDPRCQIAGSFMSMTHQVVDALKNLQDGGISTQGAIAAIDSILLPLTKSTSLVGDLINMILGLINDITGIVVNVTDAEYQIIQDHLYCAIPIPYTALTNANLDAFRSAVLGDSGVSLLNRVLFATYFNYFDANAVLNAPGVYPSLTTTVYVCDPCVVPPDPCASDSNPTAIADPTMNGSWIEKFGNGRGWTPAHSTVVTSHTAPSDIDTAWSLTSLDHIKSHCTVISTTQVTDSIVGMDVKCSIALAQPGGSTLHTYAVRFRGFASASSTGIWQNSDGNTATVTVQNGNSLHRKGYFDQWITFDFGGEAAYPDGFSIPDFAGQLLVYYQNLTTDWIEIVEVWISGSGPNPFV